MNSRHVVLLSLTASRRRLLVVGVKEDRSVAAEVRRLIRRHVEAFRENLEGRMVA